MHYIHDIDPVIIHLWGPLAIRWYGLAYIGGFIAGYFILNRRARQGIFPLGGESLQSLLMAIVIGMLAGGRLGYVLLYDFPTFISDPLVLFRLWEGGMASHGGMLGSALAVWLFSRKHHVPFLRLTDGLSLVAPLGIAFGRLANFINGELWGRPSNAPWAVYFPQEAGLDAAVAGSGDLIATAIENGIIQPRHPSQLYEAALEGIVLFLILLSASRRKSFMDHPGRVTALFTGCYAILRFGVEFFREPEIVYSGWLSQGQLLSLVVLIPLAFLFWAGSPRATPTRAK